MPNTILPPVLDFEASSLSDGGYPITEGLVINGELRYWAIKPELEWIDWYLASEAIHGIKRSELIDAGIPAFEVCVQMKEEHFRFGCKCFEGFHTNFLGKFKKSAHPCEHK